MAENDIYEITYLDGTTERVTAKYAFDDGGMFIRFSNGNVHVLMVSKLKVASVRNLTYNITVPDHP